jgi:hypothetical protein
MLSIFRKYTNFGKFCFSEKISHWLFKFLKKKRNETAEKEKNRKKRKQTSLGRPNKHPGGCGAWSAPEPTENSLKTWKNLRWPMLIARVHALGRSMNRFLRSVSRGLGGREFSPSSNGPYPTDYS